MFKYKNFREQLKEEQNKNLVLSNLLLQMQANVDYLAMMEDVDFEEEENINVEEFSEGETIL